MENLIIELLELSRQLDDSNLGEFDFGRLKKALVSLEEQGPEILRTQKEHRLLKSHLILQIMSKLRALKASGQAKAQAVWEERIAGMVDPGAEKLLEIHQALKKELNAALSTSPHYKRVCEPENVGKGKDEFKIGG
jgi:hypothetical protein